MSNEEFYLVLGIRPDIIRASLLIEDLRKRMGSNFSLIWSGQHYSANLKDVFFQQLDLDRPEVELGAKGESDAEIVSSVIRNLGSYLSENRPAGVAFLGDTNTVMGTVAAAQLNIPILHIEGGMRSYDWRMPEEKFRKVADHLSDTIYAYLPAYKDQAMAEGIPGVNIEVTGNPIVDVLNKYFISGKLRMSDSSFSQYKTRMYDLKDSEMFMLMTCHRRENIENKESLERVLNLAKASPYKVIFPAGYRTQEKLREFACVIPDNVHICDPIGYLELLELLTRAEAVLTDSGTIVEEAAVLGVPSIQMRHSTERPQVYDWGASVKFDPTLHDINPVSKIEKLLSLKSSVWKHTFGDGNSSERIANSILEKYEGRCFSSHDPKFWLPWSAKSYSEEN
jgi:UDP-N-acetylglucosamine 2-epimerase (non-hydrolysing)